MAKQEKLSLLGISAFCESMASMLGAGIDTGEAVSLLKQKGKENGPLNQGIEVIREKVEEGSSLKDAMEESGMFPQYVLDMVKTGESTGKSEDVFSRLADYYGRQHTLSEKIKTTIIYPLAMILLIIIVLFLMLKMVLPAFSNVYETLTGSLSESSYSYISYAYLFCRVALILMSVLVLVIAIAYLLYRSGYRKQILKLVKKIPGCKDILENLALYRFTSAFEVFMSSGYLQDEAASKAKKMCGDDEVEARIGKLEDEMMQGHGFAYSANESELYEPIYARMLIPAEKRGNTESALKRLSGLLSDSVMSKADSLLSSLESVLSGVLMVTVAIALLSVMLPLIGIMNSIG